MLPFAALQSNFDRGSRCLKHCCLRICGARQERHGSLLFNAGRSYRVVMLSTGLRNPKRGFVLVKLI